jgi:hypothetical protein
VAPQTVLQIVQGAAYELNQTPPATLFGNTDTSARQWLALLYALGRSIRNTLDYPTLKRKYRFDTVVGQKFYPLPGDFWRLLLNTQWDESNDWALFGPEDDGGIAGRDLGIVPYGTQYSYRVAGAISQAVDSIPSFSENNGYFEISPVASEVRELYIEYISANWFYPAVWVASTAYNSGDLVSASGAIYKATSTGSTNTTRPSGESTTIAETGISFQLYRDNLLEISADTNYPIIDPEVLIAGLKWRFLRAKGLDYQQELLDYNQTLFAAKGRYDGVKSINGDGPEWYEFPYLSEGFVSTGW